MAFARGWSGPKITKKPIVFYIDPNSPNCMYDKTSTILKDISGNGNDATFYNGCTYTSEYGGGIVLDGSTGARLSMSDQVISSPTSFNTGGFSIEQIFKISSYQPDNYYGLTNQLIRKGTASTFNYCTQVTDATTLRFTKRTSPESLKGHNFTVPDITNKVVHTVFVVSSDGSSVSLYLDGILINTIPIVGEPIEPRQDGNDPFYIGGDAGTMAFDGTYYSCRIYADELSSEEVSKNYNATKSRFI
jgi:hypothetical protein